MEQISSWYMEYTQLILKCNTMSCAMKFLIMWIIKNYVFAFTKNNVDHLEDKGIEDVGIFTWHHKQGMSVSTGIY
jgi:hypothetical protein